MERSAEIKLSLVLFISIFTHLIVMIGLFSPDYRRIVDTKKAAESLFGGRDIIVNVNEDEREVLTDSTLLSEKDSSARGFITKEKGDHWLNNSLEFKVRKGTPRQGNASERSMDMRDKSSLLIAENTEMIISLMQYEFGNVLGDAGDKDFTTIPDRNNFKRDNAIFYSTDGRFSFNTKKFKNFKYFKAMKDKIAAHWFPPLLANSIIGGYDPITGTYTPGRTRIMAIPSQEVKIYFTMNRKGDVLDIVIVDSLGNLPLDSSCVDSIRLPQNFNPVPDDIEGNVIIIPFMFGYYVY